MNASHAWFWIVGKNFLFLSCKIKLIFVKFLLNSCVPVNALNHLNSILVLPYHLHPIRVCTTLYSLDTSVPKNMYNGGTSLEKKKREKLLVLPYHLHPVFRCLKKDKVTLMLNVCSYKVRYSLFKAQFCIMELASKAGLNGVTILLLTNIVPPTQDFCFPFDTC